MNFTHVVLIPKRADPEIVAHFRPISLCNTIVKIASKCVASHLKPILDVVISPAQSTFILGRLITDNVLVAFEINHYVKNRTHGKDGYFALKLDTSKPYDRVEWNFHRSILCRLGIHEQFVRIIMSLVTSVSYSLMLEGSQFGYFLPQRGIRQGDPLSPYLFLFVAKVFSSMLQAAERREEIKGIAISRHSPKTMRAIKRILERYGQASGQKINFEKSSMMVSSNVDEQERRRKVTGGIVSISERSCMESDPRMEYKVALTNGARGLIKAVLQAIPTYVMSCFQLLDYFLHDIERMVADFWWHSKGERHTHWVGWKRLCLPREEGGMGFRELKAVNRAMLAKQGWRLLTRPDGVLSQMLKAKYFPRTSFFEAKSGTRPFTGFRVTSDPSTLELEMKISELIDAATTSWKTEMVQPLFDEEEAHAYQLELLRARRQLQSTSSAHNDGDGEAAGKQ
ncbi:UNVERIFIED_CONTAM: putative mitochondrial protein [Sesamum latifolium]|uniref:Mitochondrial protein n=1 Tax=Sesamum latifolium TaxID=2727402 RepID=A0AAW2VU05_9LAMI